LTPGWRIDGEVYGAAEAPDDDGHAAMMIMVMRTADPIRINMRNVRVKLTIDSALFRAPRIHKLRYQAQEFLSIARKTSAVSNPSIPDGKRRSVFNAGAEVGDACYKG
jgi:hypothetical protein